MNSNDLEFPGGQMRPAPWVAQAGTLVMYDRMMEESGRGA